jgi:hypothetical protein
MHGREAEGREFPPREIAQVHGDDAVRARGPRGGQHVDVGGIGQPQGRLPAGSWPVSANGEPRREARDLAARERGVPRSALPLRRARPFLQKPRRPGRHEQPRLGAACQDLAQDRGIEHAGIQDPDRPPAHGINRKASALRYPVSVSAGCCGWSGPANPVWISRGSRPPRPARAGRRRGTCPGRRHANRNTGSRRPPAPPGRRPAARRAHRPEPLLQRLFRRCEGRRIADHEVELRPLAASAAIVSKASPVPRLEPLRHARGLRPAPRQRQRRVRGIDRQRRGRALRKAGQREAPHMGKHVEHARPRASRAAKAWLGAGRRTGPSSARP